MAKKKTLEEFEPTPAIVENASEQAAIIEPENQLDENGDSEKVKEECDEAPVVAEEALSEHVVRVLKVFKTMPELYVTPTGGAFAPDTKPSIVGKAILYKNPFYNSKS